MKLIIFTTPNEVKLEGVIKLLNKEFKKLGFITNVHVLESTDINVTKTEPENPTLELIEKIIIACGGNPSNRLKFTTNFYRAVSEGFGGTETDVKVILNEIIKAKNDERINVFCKNNNIDYIFSLAEQTLGMIR